MICPPLAVGVVGVGHAGSRHAKKLKQLEDFHLMGLYDRAPTTAALWAEALEVRAFPSLEALAAEIQAATVAVPAGAHFAVCEALLLAGVDVLVEKPMAVELAEADALVALAKRLGRVLQVGHSERFNPAFLTLAEGVRQPRRIRCERVGPPTGRGTDVSVVLDLMIHDIELSLALVGETPAQIAVTRAQGRPLDRVEATLRFAGGAQATLLASRVDRGRRRRLTVEDARGVREAELDGGGDPLRAELLSFGRAVRARLEPVVSGAVARAALAVALKIEAAAYAAQGEQIPSESWPLRAQ